MPFPQRILSVFELNEYVRKTLARDPMLRGLELRGEVSNMKRYPSGHWYFSLKDDQARISCVMFRQHNFMLKDPPRDGERIVLSGSVSLYTKDGNYQFYAEALRRDGVGELFAQFMVLKEKLEAEGLFDPSIKRPVPLLPRRIGIATSQNGAVIHDIITVSGRRFSGIDLVLCPVKVQGEGAAEEIVRGIERLNAATGVDVIIIGRGGGSMEDLWAFNDERVARAIRASAVPVVSAVGHETDFTIADFAADMRAATPSQAAEICVMDRSDMLQRLNGFQRRLLGAMEKQWHGAQGRLAALQTLLLRLRPDIRLLEQERQLQALRVRLTTAAEKNALKWQERLLGAGAKLATLSPGGVLERGYALAYLDGRLVSDVHSLTPGDRLRIALKNGTADTVVQSIKGAEENG